MAIIRANKDDGNFTQIANTAVYDCRLSFKARGILLYMLSRPDDWKFFESEIASNTSDGMRAVRSGLKELEGHGYIARTKKRIGGRFQGYEYTIYECPTVMLKRQNGESEENDTVITFCENGKTENGKSHTTNTNSTNTERTNKRDNGFFSGEKESSPLKDNLKDKDILDFIEWYRTKAYVHYYGYEHPRLKKDQKQYIHDTLLSFCGDFGVDNDGLKEMSKSFFEKVQSNDHNINHFVAGDMLETRYYECLY